eukprot:CAMPEP_0170131592 /NCGR_PEP_ID=MMETSP0020_2-20130122/23351_1 /TAXON_ID=98059 /ORGANISM="Dinobryon sp., Strain UTEXLB2267" /LENGTH=411 /DNA_ID=CAMNT_0010366719 /DNA_START=332 /DNA_END=1564 /DNA_ORIENTATION=-
MLLKGETEVEAFYRVIVAQLMDSNGYKGKVVPDWEYLDNHIGDKPFILLVDEINALSFPLSGKLSIILKNYFLDKPNRFLVISSHFPVDFDVEFNRKSCGCFRPSRVLASDLVGVLSLPICTDIQLLRQMGDKCGQITVPAVAYYGGIPSLIFCKYQNDDVSPASRFLHYKFRAIPSWKNFVDFVDEVMEGKLRGVEQNDIHCFDKLASFRTVVVGIQKEERLQWPLCYIACVLEMIGTDPLASEIVSLINRIQFYQDQSQAGNWWEEVVKIAFLLRFVQSANFGVAGPFMLYTTWDVAEGATILIKRLGPETKTVSAAKIEIDSELAQLSNGCYLLLFVPSHPKFELFDGFVSFIKVRDGGSDRKTMVINLKQDMPFPKVKNRFGYIQPFSFEAEREKTQRFPDIGTMPV